MKRIVAIFSLALLIGTMGVVNADAWGGGHGGGHGHGPGVGHYGFISHGHGRWYHYNYNPNVEINTTTQIGWYRHCGLTNSSNPGVTRIANVAGPDGYGRYLWQQTMVGSVPRSSTETASLSCF